jgi:hypothetical protein
MPGIVQCTGSGTGENNHIPGGQQGQWVCYFSNKLLTILICPEVAKINNCQNDVGTMHVQGHWQSQGSRRVSTICNHSRSLSSFIWLYSRVSIAERSSIRRR